MIGGATAHYDGIVAFSQTDLRDDSWSHISEGIDDVIAAFDAAGIGHRLSLTPHGHWTNLDGA